MLERARARVRGVAAPGCVRRHVRSSGARSDATRRGWYPGGMDARWRRASRLAAALLVLVCGSGRAQPSMTSCTRRPATPSRSFTAGSRHRELRELAVAESSADERRAKRRRMPRERAGRRQRRTGRSPARSRRSRNAALLSRAEDRFRLSSRASWGIGGGHGRRAGHGRTLRLPAERRGPGDSAQRPGAAVRRAPAAAGRAVSCGRPAAVRGPTLLRG